MASVVFLREQKMNCVKQNISKYGVRALSPTRGPTFAMRAVWVVRDLFSKTRNSAHNRGNRGPMRPLRAKRDNLLRQMPARRRATLALSLRKLRRDHRNRANVLREMCKVREMLCAYARELVLRAMLRDIVSFYLHASSRAKGHAVARGCAPYGCAL
jgi:hypothetical protein